MKIVLFGFALILIAILALAYAQWRATDQLMEYATSIFEGDVAPSETQDSPLLSYNWRTIENLGEEPSVEFTLERRFVLHNFSDGYIWIRYSMRVYNSEHKLVYGAGEIPALWKIHRGENGWEVIEVFERP